MRRPVSVILAIILAAFVVGACDRLTRDPDVPSLPAVFGARVTDDQLRIWTGSPCTEVTRVTVNFSSENAMLVLEPPPGQWADVEYLALAEPYAGLDVVEPLPDGFDWRTAETVDLWLDAAEGEGSTRANVADIIDGSADHPDDTYWFQGVGWLNPAEVAARDGTTFLATCTPDPAQEPSLPPAFGARVTDGELRIWAGAPCPVTNGVTLVFKPDDSRPDAVDLTLDAPADATVDFERLTLGGLTPGLQVLEALPAGFDWRSQASLMLEVHTTETHRESTTDLAEVVAGSAEHPDDTYWFQGVGWLDPAAVADQNGTTFLATCTPDPAKE